MNDTTTGRCNGHRLSGLLLLCLCAFLAPGSPPGWAAPVAGPDPAEQRVLTRMERIEARIGITAQGCLAARQEDNKTPQRSDLSRLFAILALSPLGAEALQIAAGRGILVCFDPKTRNMAYYIAGLRVIALQPAMSEGARIAFLAHELAHVPQHPVYSDNRYFPVDDLVLLRRVREAAAEAAAARMLWQLRRIGYDDAWRAKARTGYGDILRAYAAALPAVPTSQGEALATRAAYDCWFDRPFRVDQYDAMTVAHLETIAVDEMGLVPPRRFLTDFFLQGIGALGRNNYLALPHHRALAGVTYRRGLSDDNLARLERALDPARLAREETAELPDAASPN